MSISIRLLVFKNKREKKRITINTLKAFSPYSLFNEYILHTWKNVNVQSTHHHRRRIQNVTVGMIVGFFFQSLSLSLCFYLETHRLLWVRFNAYETYEIHMVEM